MNKPLQIGITGGIGSGKSLVCRIFKHFGVPVYDADSRAKYLMTTDGILITQIKKEFGDLSFDNDGNLNRKYLGERVFGDTEQLEKLNKLVHPRVSVDYDQWVQQNSEEAYLLKEAALLFESGSYRMLDKIIVVYAPEELRLQRVLKRDTHRTEKLVKGIMEKQSPEEEKLKRADYIIYNDETQLITPQILALHRTLSMLSRSGSLNPGEGKHVN